MERQPITAAIEPAEVRDHVRSRFLQWAHIGPIGNFAGAVVWFGAVAEPVPFELRVTWLVAVVVACIGMTVAIVTPRSSAWTNDLGVPRLSIASLSFMGLLWATTFWLHPDAASDQVFVYGTAAVLFAITTGTISSSSGSISSTAALLAPLTLGMVVAFAAFGYWLESVGIVVLIVLTVPVQLQAARTIRELIALRLDSESSASIDPLTGLLNRRGFEQAVARREPSHSLSMIFVDLDHFKSVNDRLGHEAGDMVLCMAARRIKDAAPGAVVSRIGGDEFVIASGGTTGAASDEADFATARRILNSLREPFALPQDRVHISASAGISRGGSLGEMFELIAEADLAMFAAKQTGGDMMVAAHTRQVLPDGTGRSGRDRRRQAPVLAPFPARTDYSTMI